jgi:inorganic pyrophosphatase
MKKPYFQKGITDRTDPQTTTAYSLNYGLYSSTIEETATQRPDGDPPIA